MPVRTANAQWEGGFKRGSGNVALGSGVFEGPYSARDRFEDGPNTNPEELIGAAHAGCFTMALSLGLEQAGNPPDKLETSAKVHIDPQEGGGFAITKIELSLVGRVPGMDEAAFKEAAEGAKAGCPVSKALASVPEITLDARLEGE